MNWLFQRWPSVLAVGTTAMGIISDPSVLGLLPHKWAVALAAIGTVWTSITKPIHTTDTPK